MRSTIAMSRSLKMLTLLMLLTLALAACGAPADNQATNEPAPAGEVEEPAEEAAEEAAVAELTTNVGNELAYNPAEFSVADGTTAEITMINEGALEHNWVWEDQEDQEFLNTAPGETASATRTFDAPGVYGFYCNIPGHREAGMIGSVTVGE